MIRKLAGLPATLLATSFVIFGAAYAAPGDPVTFLAGGKDNLSPEHIAAVRAQYHLDDPFVVQYGRWLGDAVTGDLGRSLQYNDQVGDLLAARLPSTLGLVAYSTVLFVVFGVGLGVLAAVRGGRVDAAVVAGTTFATSVPPFVVATALISLFGVQLGWFPVLGGGSLWHLTLPAVTLATGALAIISRVTRQAMIEQRELDHVTVARASGLSERLIVVRHVLRGALGPIVTMCGLVTAGMLAGTVVVETAFGISGVGSLLVHAINTHDFPVTQAVLLLMVAAYITVTTLVELLQPLIDPRTRRAA
ncbi:ABC transporter permease [Nonomuraea muscovyensis]|uniref:Peptide/nickel transport system permease protein n=1 Tax=Nonomuraea muscovyensis TaxID=1124761 RepID=A0A7X0CAI2_9ACTN|nr:ABC transporter permease [Nonomuraea muscovyensis]MBB6350081.1 peptide/nickel transport system permease protein [Nonomuraea muscovyensis]MDF2707996.1 putative transporter permease protein [Nonomuraea muscovyensis]